MPALDCTGAQVRWNGPALACEDGAVARAALPDRPLATTDVLATPVSPTRTLVWIPTSRFASGDALGPVALVEAVGSRLRVLALGPLRAYPQHARLRLEALGERKVLVAEGELCSSAEPASCVRAARLVPLRDDRFVSEPLLGTDGKCLSPAWFDLSHQEQRRSETRRERLELGASLSFGGTHLAIEEQVVVLDLGANPEGAPARIVHRAQSTRTVRWVADRLVVSGTSLWTRMTQGRAGVAR
ncbi:MAG: hypothetical protein A2V77_20615 [Anaeromyxobacter sp. RBG_16_69_14]|nr:MAG: hypothetical protein A2V77_20615 [Anaeromyxobacter sp. RBG_16_69_14]